MDSKIEQILKVILGHWTLPILWVLHQRGPTRFNELKRQLGPVTSKVLTSYLRTLESRDIITRSVTPAKISAVSYQISSKGQSLRPLLEAIYQVSQQWEADTIETSHSHSVQYPLQLYNPPVQLWVQKDTSIPVSDSLQNV